MSELTVIDFFCGAGGFSEGFRQQGFKIVLGVDNWQPAIDTFNHNFGLNCSTRNILDFESSTEEIESLPNTDVIIGSPPCVTFSSSNISGKADKGSGITLTQVFLKIVAIKKWQKGSILKAWYMENVPNSIKHLASEYTFEELGLSDWALKNKIGKSKVAIRLIDNHEIINSADYGSAQTRKRVISGELIKRKKLTLPKPTHGHTPKEVLLPWKTLMDVQNKLPKPTCRKSSRKIVDSNYPQIEISMSKLTDHFYDTALYECEWKQSKFLKTNHPYMGRMSFPENRNSPSRTITATKIGTSREAIIYESSYKRQGNGEYRTPTVREAASIMSFPITFQFIGSEGIKWRLVGNAVCPSVSRAFARELRKDLGLYEISEPLVSIKPSLIANNDLNTYQTKKFETPPRRNNGSRFRRHPFKDGNITVTLSNYDINKNEKEANKWITSVQYGNGKGFPSYNFPDGFYLSLEPLLSQTDWGNTFLRKINNGFVTKIGSRRLLQEMYERQSPLNGLLETTDLIEEVSKIIENLRINKMTFPQNGLEIFKDKCVVPTKQLLALYAINKVASIANATD